jgi:hypothetical protein
VRAFLLLLLLFCVCPMFCRHGVQLLPVSLTMH